MMTGNELQAELIAKLKTALPQAEIRPAFADRAERKPGQPAVCVGIRKEVRAAGLCTAEFGIWLYTGKAEEAAALFEAVCAAMEEMPCALRRIMREEMRYEEAAGCTVTVCRAEVECAASAQNTEAMRFGDFVFCGLPEMLEVKRQGNVPETADVSGRTSAEYTGGGRREVTGKGAFFGADAAQRYADFEEKFGCEDTLFLPGMAPFRAVLSSAAVTEPITDGMVRFQFRFEEPQEQRPGFSGRIYPAAGGESLWDYADRTGVSVEALAACNPQIACINALQPGEEVHIP